MTTQQNEQDVPEGYIKTAIAKIRFGISDVQIDTAARRGQLSMHSVRVGANRFRHYYKESDLLSVFGVKDPVPTTETQSDMPLLTQAAVEQLSVLTRHLASTVEQLSVAVAGLADGLK